MAWTIEMLKSLRRREDGQDLLEYALLISLIALVAAIRDVMRARDRGYQVLPGTAGLDGFYFACLEKVS